jgi:hypothetical protein
MADTIIWDDPFGGKRIGRVDSDDKVWDDPFGGKRIGRVEGDNKLAGGAALLLLLKPASKTPSKESKSTSSTGSAPANRSISSNGNSDGNFWLGLVIKIITNPVGLTVLGVAIFLLGIGYKEGPAFLVTGLVIMGLGILWLVLRSRGARKAIAAYLPRYNEIAEALKNSGYEVAEFERKSDHIRSSVRLNGESIGETFLVVSSWNKKMEGVLEICVGRVKGAFEKKNGKSPDGSCFYWPEDSAIGAFVEASADNWSEKQEWLSKLADMF